MFAEERLLTVYHLSTQRSRSDKDCGYIVASSLLARMLVGIGLTAS